MQELRHLFALMLGSKRKYVDPSKALDILKEAFTSNTGNAAGVDSQQVHKIVNEVKHNFEADFGEINRRHFEHDIKKLLSSQIYLFIDDII